MKNIPEELIPVIDYWERHGKVTVAVAVAAIVVGVGCWVWNSQRNKTRCEVTDALVSNFTDEYGIQLSTPVEGLEAAIGKAVDPTAVPLLKLRLAKAQYAAGNYAAAGELYGELKAAGAAPAGFEDVPAYGYAATLEAGDKFAEAREAYGVATNAFPRSTLRLEAEMGVARCLAREGRKDLAVKTLQARLARLEALEATQLAKQEELKKAEERVVTLRHDEKLTSEQKEKVLKLADAAVKSLKADLAGMEAEMRTKDLALSRVRATLDLVKRWENRAEASLVDSLGQVSETVKAAETPSPAEAEKPAAPAEKKAE